MSPNQQPDGPKYVTDCSPEDILMDVYRILQQNRPQWTQTDYDNFQELKETLMRKIVFSSNYKPTKNPKPAPKAQPTTATRPAPAPEPAPAPRRVPATRPVSSPNSASTPIPASTSISRHEAHERKINLENSERLRLAREEILAEQATEGASKPTAVNERDYIQGHQYDVDNLLYLLSPSQRHRVLVQTDPSTGNITIVQHPRGVPLLPGGPAEGPPRDINGPFRWPDADDYFRVRATRAEQEQHPPAPSDLSLSPSPAVQSLTAKSRDSFSANAENREDEANGEVEKDQPDHRASVENASVDDSGIVIEDAHNGASTSPEPKPKRSTPDDSTHGTQSQPVAPADNDKDAAMNNDSPAPTPRRKKTPATPSKVRRSSRLHSTGATPAPPAPPSVRKRARDPADDNEVTKKKKKKP